VRSEAKSTGLKSATQKSVATLSVVDSCGWLEYLAGGENAGFFEAALLDTTHLLVPSLCIYEVSKHLIRHSGLPAAQEVLGFMRKGRIVALSDEQLLKAAHTSHQHQLSMADAIIWQTAHEHSARLLTQDAGLKDMPHVSYTPKQYPPTA
jgi:toxin FitB